MRNFCLAEILIGAFMSGVSCGASLHISPQGDDAPPDHQARKTDGGKGEGYVQRTQG